MYAAGEVDPVLHKLLHGGIGAASGFVLHGKEGALTGASAAVVAETLADIIRPQVEAALTAIAVNADSAESYHEQAEEYLNTQHNLILLTSVSITASLGGDVDMATYAADNALSHNALPTLEDLAASIGTLKDASTDALEACGRWIDAHPLEIEMGVVVLMGTLESAAESRGHSHKTAATQAQKKDMLVRAIKACPDLVKRLATRRSVVSKAVPGVKMAPPGGAVRSDAFPKGSKIEYVAPGRVTFDGVEFKAVRDLGHVDESGLRDMLRKGISPKNIQGQRLDGHHHKQQYHRDTDAFIVEIPSTQHSIGNANQHPLGNKGGLTKDQRKDWDRLRVAFNKERAKAELMKRGLYDN